MDYKELTRLTASSINEHALVEEKEADLRHQESALVKLGELYRDQKYVRVAVWFCCMLNFLP